MKIDVKKAFYIHRKIRNKAIYLPDILIISKDLNVWSVRFNVNAAKSSIERYSHYEIARECKQFLYLPKPYVSYDDKLKSKAIEAAYSDYERFLSIYI